MRRAILLVYYPSAEESRIQFSVSLEE